MEFGVARIGMDTLAGNVIDSSYLEMKSGFPSDLHNYWEWKPMDQASLNYAAVDGYVSYELYRRIRDMKNSLGPTWLEMIRPWCKSKD